MINVPCLGAQLQNILMIPHRTHAVALCSQAHIDARQSRFVWTWGAVWFAHFVTWSDHIVNWLRWILFGCRTMWSVAREWLRSFSARITLDPGLKAFAPHPVTPRKTNCLPITPARAKQNRKYSIPFPLPPWNRYLCVNIAFGEPNSTWVRCNLSSVYKVCDIWGPTQ